MVFMGSHHGRGVAAHAVIVTCSQRKVNLSALELYSLCLIRGVVWCVYEAFMYAVIVYTCVYTCVYQFSKVFQIPFSVCLVWRE